MGPHLSFSATLCGLALRLELRRPSSAFPHTQHNFVAVVRSFSALNMAFIINPAGAQRSVDYVTRFAAPKLVRSQPGNTRLLRGIRQRRYFLELRCENGICLYGRHTAQVLPLHDPVSDVTKHPVPRGPVTNPLGQLT